MTLVPVPGGLPEQVAQLLTGAPTRGSDCNVATTYLAIQFASDGRVVIATDRPAAMAQIRRWMGVPSGATTIKNAVKALTHPELVALFHAAGLKAPVVKSRRGVSWDRIEADLRAGAFVDLHVNYGVLVASGRVPTYSRSFKGGHAIALLGGPVPVIGLTNEADPLATHWQRASVGAFRQAAGLYGKKPWGVGKAEALSVLRAKPLHDDKTLAKLTAYRMAVANAMSAIEDQVAKVDKATTEAAA